MATIKTICCQCGDLIKDGPLSKEGLESHGYCRRCAGVVMAFVGRMKDARANRSKKD